LKEAEVIICRAGYSTLMDLAVLNKKAILVPTPGQTEQEYLAKELSKKGMALIAQQHDLQLQNTLEKVNEISGFHSICADDKLLLSAIEKDILSGE
jgi:UDP-N-acetylglucosamine:LPS N-acetylglucosamine transferase